MYQRLIRLCFPLVLAASVCDAFHPPAALQKPPGKVGSPTTLASHSDEVSRRVALVTAAAVAAGSIITPAQAANLEKKVSALESKNVANTNGAPEKHLPQVTVEASTVQVVVPHVMDPEKPHYIEFMWLKDMISGKVVAVKSFQATDAAPPTLTAAVASGGTVKPLLFCNLHGLWEGETIVV